MALGRYKVFSLFRATGVVTLVAVFMMIAVVPAYAYSGNNFAGGLSWPTAIYGTEVKIETKSPVVLYSTVFSCAWNMITLTYDHTPSSFTGTYKYMQVGWMKTYNTATRTFTEYNPSGEYWDFTRDFWDYAGPSGEMHTYKITSDSQRYYLMVDGVTKKSLTTGSSGDLPWAPGNTYEYLGEVVNANAHFPGTTSNHASFTDGGYKDVNGVWRGAYYYQYYSPSPPGNSTANNASTSFDIWDGRD